MVPGFLSYNNLCIHVESDLPLDIQYREDYRPIAETVDYLPFNAAEWGHVMSGLPELYCRGMLEASYYERGFGVRP